MANLINYHGGVQLGRMTPLALFASISWADGSTVNWPPNYWFLRCQVDTFFHDFLASTYIDALRQHLAVPNVNISPGPYAGTTGLSVSAQASPNGTLGDGAIQAALQSAIHGGVLAYSTSPTFYCVMVPPGVVVIGANGIRSDDPNRGFGGYHGVFQGANVGPINYCVIVGIGDIDELTYRLSHETVEHMTNSDASGWKGDPDQVVNKSIGFPANSSPEVCDYTVGQAVGVHGWSVAPFAYDVERTPQGVIEKRAPDSDQVPRTDPDGGKIHLDTKSTRTSCLGGILESQQAYFEVTASHYGQNQVISTLQWSSKSNPPAAPVIEVNGNISRTYVLLIPIGCKSVTVKCQIQTAFLGCSLSVESEFRVITQAEANQDQKVCDFINLLKKERWFDPLWWLKQFDPEVNPKAIRVADAITRIAAKERVGARVLAKAKSLVLKDLATRVNAMIAAFRIGRGE